jgi:branched-chain amino acid transport system substrate-binding protein
VVKKSTWNIGVIDNFNSSSFITDPPEEQSAISAWQNYINAGGGFNGHHVKVYVENDQGNPTVGTAALQTLINTDHVVAVIGEASFGTPAYQQYLDAAHIPFISPFTFFPTPENTDPNYFPAGGTSDGVDLGIVALLKKAGTKEFGYISSSAGGAGAQAGLAIMTTDVQAAGIGIYSQLLGTVVNYTSTCLAMQQAGVTIAYVGTGFLPNIANDCAAQNYHPQYIYQLTGNTANNVTPIVSNPVDNGVITLDWAFPWFLQVPALKTFHKVMQEYGGGIPLGPTTAVTWEAFAELQYAMSRFAAIKNTHGLPVGRGIENELYSIRSNIRIGGVDSPLNIVRGTNKIQKCFYTISISNGKLVGSMTPTCG